MVFFAKCGVLLSNRHEEYEVSMLSLQLRMPR